MIKVAIGADHRGYEHKLVIQEGVHIEEKAIEWIDVGCFNNVECDYPIQAKEVVDLMRSHEVHCGILLCGTGVGMAIAANRFKGIFAALCWNEEVARRSKEEDQANILVVPSDYVSPHESIVLVRTWLEASFKSLDRYQRRIDQINAFGGQ